MDTLIYATLIQVNVYVNTTRLATTVNYAHVVTMATLYWEQTATVLPVPVQVRELAWSWKMVKSPAWNVHLVIQGTVASSVLMDGSESLPLSRVSAATVMRTWTRTLWRTATGLLENVSSVFTTQPVSTVISVKQATSVTLWLCLRAVAVRAIAILWPHSGLRKFLMKEWLLYFATSSQDSACANLLFLV